MAEEAIMIHKIGLTGGVGAGKSTVAALLRDHGMVVVDLDDIGRKVSLDPQVIRDINTICGLSGDNLDRSKVREILFSDDKIRKAVENRLHPVILQEFEKESKIAEENGHRAIICEAALLVESGYHQHLEELVVVTATEDQRRQRLMARDGVDEKLAQKILDAQTTDLQKLKHATYILKNDSSKEILKERVEDLLETWDKKSWLSRVH